MIRVTHVTDLTTCGAEMMLYRTLQVMDRSRSKAEVFSLRQEHLSGDKIADWRPGARAPHLEHPVPDVERLALRLRRGRLGGVFQRR